MNLKYLLEGLLIITETIMNVGLALNKLFYLYNVIIRVNVLLQESRYVITTS